MFEELQTQIEKLIQPISPDQPCGEDPKYEDAYADLKQEIAKMGGMGVGATDWEKVAAESTALLENTAKELNLAAFLAAAWAVNHGTPGLVSGMDLVAGLVETFWEDMYPPPKKIKPRRGALAWLQDRLGERIAECEAPDRALTEHGLASVNRLKDLVNDRFEDPPCNFKQIRKVFEDWLAQPPEEAPEPEPAPDPDSGPSKAGETAKSEPLTAPKPKRSEPQPKKAVAPVEVPEIGEDAGLDQLSEALAKIATQFRTALIGNPAGFKIQRAALWHGASEPNGNDNGETFFPAPAEEIGQALKTMYTRGVWDQLLERAEDLTNRWWYWLDLQSYASEAAAGLGFESIQTVIDRETHALDLKCPNLKDLKFNDGTPFAAGETKEWLESLAGRLQTGGGSAEPDPAVTLRAAMREQGGDFSGAMQAAQAAISTAPNARQALRLRLEAARFCLEIEQREWAGSFAQTMVEEIEKNGLAYWEPSLAARVWQLMLKTARLLKEENDAYRDWEARAMRALAAYDPGLAGRFPQKKQDFE